MPAKRKAEARRWLQQALYDLKATRWNSQGGFHIPSRYPNGLPSGYPHRFYGKPMAEQAVAAAERILAAVRAHYQAHGDEEVLAPEDAASE